MNAQTILTWVKSNLVIVILAVVTIAALVAFPLITQQFSRDVQERLSSRERIHRQLVSMERTSIDVRNPVPWWQPPRQTTTLVNEGLLERYRQLSSEVTEDAARVETLAVQHNRKGRGVLVAELFPQPPVHMELSNMARAMSDRLQSGYRALLNEMNAGSPPALDLVQQDLIRDRTNFIERTFQKNEATDDLTSEERLRLAEELGRRRIGLYEEEARRLNVYASMRTINPPTWELGQTVPSVEQMFRWQWNFWMLEDFFRAVARVNEEADSVLNSAVKRIVSVGFPDQPMQQRGGGQQQRGGQQPPGGGTGNFSLSGGGADLSGGGTGLQGAPTGGAGQQAAPGAQPGETGMPYDPSQEVSRDYSRSFSGRKTNPLYDVRLIRVELIVDTERLPEVLDAIARENFMTVIDMELVPLLGHEDLSLGYVYGRDPVSHIRLDIETVWLRTWTKQFMPAGIRTELGIPEEQSGEDQPLG